MGITDIRSLKRNAFFQARNALEYPKYLYDTRSHQAHLRLVRLCLYGYLPGLPCKGSPAVGLYQNITYMTEEEERSTVLAAVFLSCLVTFFFSEADSTGGCTPPGIL